MPLTILLVALVLLAALVVALARAIRADGRGRTPPPRSHHSWDETVPGLPRR